MEPWTVKLGLVVALGLGFAVYLWRKSRRLTHQAQLLDGPLAFSGSVKRPHMAVSVLGAAGSALVC